MKSLITVPMFAVISVFALLLAPFHAAASTPGGDVRLTHDDASNGGYQSDYTLATGMPYTDPVLQECSHSRGRQNEPSDAVDPRNTNVILGSSNDYCPVYLTTSASGIPQPTGPIWLGYYRSENAGGSFVSSLVPGYPGDTSPFAALAQTRTASAGDPVVAWDNQGRAFFGSESSGDPAGTSKSFGDVFVARFDNPNGVTGNPQNDGKQFRGSVIVSKGSSAPNNLGKFNDKTALEVDRSGACNGDVYFAYSRFTGNAQTNAIYFSRSTDHGATFSPPMKITAAVHGVQDPSIAVTGNGHVYVTFREFASQSGQPDAIDITKSTDCGQSFTMAQQLQTFTPYDAQDVLGPSTAPSAPPASEDPLFDADTASAGSSARDCGDFSSACKSGYTFFRHTTAPRSTADQFDRTRELVYIVYDPTKPGTQVATGTTYGSVQSGIGSQEGVYFTVLNGATGTHTTPRLLDNQAKGHQLFPAISADGGTLHVLWWDSRLDPCYSPQRPIGNCPDRSTVPSLDVYATQSPAPGNAFSTPVRVTNVTSNPNYEQFAGRTVPFAGDYLYISSMGTFSYGVWTDWRDTVQGTDPRETNNGESPSENADVLQCRALNSSTGTYGSDTCPRSGGLDQNIYGDYTP